MEKEGNYLLGIIGGIVLGLIASIPWFLVYVKLDMIIALLAIPIALGVSFGYRKLKGPVNKSLPVIISVITICIVSLISLVVIPLYIMNEVGFAISFESLKLVYQLAAAELLRDFAISVAFAILGIWGIVKSDKKKINGAAKEENSNQTNM